MNLVMGQKVSKPACRETLVAGKSVFFTRGKVKVGPHFGSGLPVYTST